MRPCATIPGFLLRTVRNLLRLIPDVPHQRGGTAKRRTECTALAESADIIKVDVNLRQHVWVGLAALREFPQLEVPPQCTVKRPRRLKVGAKPTKALVVGC